METHVRERESHAHTQGTVAPHTHEMLESQPSLPAWMAHSFPALVAMRESLKQQEDHLSKQWLAANALFDKMRPPLPPEAFVPVHLYALARAPWIRESLPDGRLRIYGDAATWASAATSLACKSLKAHREEAQRRAKVLKRYERALERLRQQCGYNAWWSDLNDAANELSACEDAIILKTPETFADVAQQVAVLRSWGHGGEDDGMIGAFFETLERAAREEKGGRSGDTNNSRTCHTKRIAAAAHIGV